MSRLSFEFFFLKKKFFAETFYIKIHMTWFCGFVFLRLIR